MASPWQGRQQHQPGQVSGYPYNQVPGYGQPQHQHQQQFPGYDANQAAYYGQYYGAQHAQAYHQPQGQYPGYGYPQQGQNWSAYQQNQGIPNQQYTGYGMGHYQQQQPYPQMQGQYPPNTGYPGGNHPASQYSSGQYPLQNYQQHQLSMTSAASVTSSAMAPSSKPETASASVTLPSGPTSTSAEAPTPISSVAPTISCVNCGSQDHWAVNCPNNIRVVTPQTSAVNTQAAPQSKGPVITKYAVPPHIAAAMKARGIPGAPSAAPVLPQHVPRYKSVVQYPGIQTQPGYSSYPHQPPSMAGQHWQMPPHSGATPPSSMALQGSHQALPPSTVTPQPQTPQQTLPQASAATSPTAGEIITATKVDETIPSGESEKTVVKEKSSPSEDENTAEDSVSDEDDLGLLDIPDMPKSYGTESYEAPKLLAKPLYSLAPEWTHSGLGEITLSKDLQGRTTSEYIKTDDDKSELKNYRTAAHDHDPIFAEIDLDAPAPSPESRESGKSALDTPPTDEYVDTRATSPDDQLGYRGSGRYSDDERRRSRTRSRGRYHRQEPRYYDTRRSPPRQGSFDHAGRGRQKHKNRNKKDKRDRRDRRVSEHQDDRKRKRSQEDVEQDVDEFGRDIKKHQRESPDTKTLGSFE